MTNYRFFIFAALGTVSLLAGFIFFIKIGADQPNLNNRQDCPNEFADDICLEKLFREILKESGAKRAVARLQELEPRLTYWKCHRLSHIIGVAWYQTGGMPAQLMTGSSGGVCSHGILHGALIGYVLSQNPDRSNVMRLVEEACGSPKNDEREFPTSLRHCYHGFGHGLFVAFAGNLLETLRLCDSASLRKELASRCYDGAFMENALLLDHSIHGGAHIEGYSYHRAGDALYPCRLLDEEYRQICHYSAIQQYFHENIERPDFNLTDAVIGAFRKCKKSAAAYISSCIRGIGVWVGYLSNWKEDVMKEHCFRGSSTNEKKLCLEGAALRYSRVAGENAVRFCASLTPPYQNGCFEILNNRILP